MYGRVFNFSYNCDGEKPARLSRFEPFETKSLQQPIKNDLKAARERIEAALQQALIEWLPNRQSRASLQISLIGLHLHTA